VYRNDGYVELPASTARRTTDALAEALRRLNTTMDRLGLTAWCSSFHDVTPTLFAHVIEALFGDRLGK
jgi:hypothetical protein